MSGPRYRRSNKQVDKTQILWPSAAMVAELKTNPKARLKPREQRTLLTNDLSVQRIYATPISHVKSAKVEERIPFTAIEAQPEKIAAARKIQLLQEELADAKALFSIESYEGLGIIYDPDVSANILSANILCDAVDSVFSFADWLIKQIPNNDIDKLADDRHVTLLLNLRALLDTLIPLHIINNIDNHEKCAKALETIRVAIYEVAPQLITRDRDLKQVQLMLHHVESYITLKQNQLKTPTPTIKKEEPMALPRPAGNKAAPETAAAPEAPAPQTLQEYLNAFETALNILIADVVREATLDLTPKLNVLFFALVQRIETMRENRVSDKMILNGETGDQLQQLYSILTNIDPVTITDEEIEIALTYLNELEKEIVFPALAKKADYDALYSQVSAEIAAVDARMTPITAEKSSEPDIYDIALHEVLDELTKPSPTKSIKDDIRDAYDIDGIMRELGSAKTNEGDASSTESLAHSESNSGSGKSSRSDELLDSGIKPAPTTKPIKEVLAPKDGKKPAPAGSEKFPRAKSTAVSKKPAATMPELGDETSHSSKANTVKEKFDQFSKAVKEKAEELRESVKDKAEAARQAAKDKAEVVLKKISKKHARTADEELKILRQTIASMTAYPESKKLETALSNLEQQLGEDLSDKVYGSAKENSSAAQLLRDTNKMMAELRRKPAAGEFKDDNEYRQHLNSINNKYKRTISPSNLKKFGKAVAAVLSALGGLIAGAVIGGGIGIGAGAWSGPGAVATGVAGVFTGAATGAGIGLVAGATAVGITAGTVSGIFLFKKPSPAAKMRLELAKAVVKEASEENQKATLPPVM